ncbi:unnamed protein product [Cylicocyclus nassatus]|uniref:Uncharacterized protein n=1 Tax=Cylicocyclus nassatus TaxID=53992 RepID=A0AA36DT22_CYLNA|nr:unnamed protein product [Cylicocyclus nassatus]
MADGESISKLVIDVEVNDKKALLALNALQQRIKNFNSSNGGKAISDMASNMEKMTRNTAQARREAGQFIEQLKKNNKNLMPKDIYSKSIQQWQKELTTAQDKMKNIMSKSNPMKSLTGLEDYTNKAIKARNAIEALQKAQEKFNSNSLANFTRIEPADNGKPLKEGEFERIRALQNQSRAGIPKGSYFYEETEDELAKFEKEVRAAEELQQKLNSVSNKVKQLSAYAPTQVKPGQELSKEYTNLETSIDKASQKLEKLYQKQALMSKANPNTERYQKLQIDIKGARAELDGLVRKMRELQESGKDVTSGKKGNFDFAKQFASSNKALTKFSSAVMKVVSDLSKKLMRPLTRLATMFRAMLLRRFIMQVFKSMKEAVDQLAQYSNTIGSDFNKSVSSIVDNFKYLGRVIVTAFEPLINFAAPIIDFLIQKIVDAINAINQFVNAIFGNSTWTKASYNASNYAESLDKASGSAKKLKQQLQGFDELNNLSSNQGGGGSGGGGGAANVGDLFSTQQISESAKGMAERFKEAWKNADFTDIGGDIADKITNALNSINWDGIKTTANKIAKSIATFLNGFINPDLFGAVGETLAESLNTVFGAVGTFANVFDWSNLGKSIASTINKFFETFDFKGAGMTLMSLATGIVSTLTSAISNVEWNVVGEKIIEFLEGLDFAKLIGSAASLAASILSGLTQLLFGAVGELANNAATRFKETGLQVITNIVSTFWGDDAAEKVKEVATNIVDGLAKGIKDNLNESATWVRDAFQKVIDAVKKFFGINSPSTEFAKLGAFCVEGLKEGMINTISNIKEWISSNIMDKIQSAFKVGEYVIDFCANITSWLENLVGDKNIDFCAKLTSWLEKLGGNNKYINFVAKMTSWLLGMKKDAKDGTVDSINYKAKISSWYKAAGLDTTMVFTAKVGKVMASTAEGITDKIIQEQASRKANGGAFFGGAWHNIAQFASGGIPGHGTLFVAGENGAEAVTNIGGRTEVLNQSQMASVMYSSVFSAMQAAMSNGSQPIQVYLDGKVVFDSTRQYAQDYARRNGIPAF